MSFENKNSSHLIFRAFILIWALLNLVQAYFSPLESDEAYYWMYSRYLDWGYFDHPPMIALMIKAGYSLFSNELGLRFFTVIAQVLTLVIIWSLTRDATDRSTGSALFLILLISSFPLMNIYGFISTPDSPLLFFEALFLYLYNKTLQKNGWITWILLGLTMSAIMYSKYHGALLIILVILSNLKLLLNGRFYFSALIALIFFMPHLYWQYSNDFLSFKYHLVGRISGFDLSEIPQYLYNTILTYNPLIFPVALYLIFRYRNQDKFERALIFIVSGTLLFFLPASFRDHVEPQWTAIITMPLIVLVINNIHKSKRIYSYLKPVTVLSVFLMLFARTAFMIDFLPVKYLRTRFFEAEQRSRDIEKIAGDRPVIFANSYQKASRYTFYTGKFAHALNDLYYRKNQFDLWNFEEQLQGKEVLYVPYMHEGIYEGYFDKYITSEGDSVFAKIITGFESMRRECCYLPETSYTFRQMDSANIDLLLFNPYPYPLDLKNENSPVTFHAGFFKEGKLRNMILMQFSEDIRMINPGDTIPVTGTFRTDDIQSGEYKLAICSVSGFQYPVRNSKPVDAYVIR